jgi:hyperosmotically inducible periplasmic protein
MKKLFSSILFSLLVTALPSAGAPAAMIGQAPAATSQLERDIGRELLLLPGYTVFDKLGFELNGSTVRLTGEVVHRELKGAAERAVKEVRGVRRVVNDIEVLPSTSLDDQIRMAAFRAIYGECAFSGYASEAIQPIHILVHNGCLTLEGAVANEADREAVYAKALAVPGVLTVSNRLRIVS